LGQDQSLKIPALYDLWWDPGENYDIVFNGAAPTRGDFKTSPGRYSGEDNGWIGLYINPPMEEFWAEMKTHPNFHISRSAPAPMNRFHRSSVSPITDRNCERGEGANKAPSPFFSLASLFLTRRASYRVVPSSQHVVPIRAMIPET
jgi:hypothetical protein